MGVSPLILALQGFWCNFPKKSNEWVCIEPRKRPRWPGGDRGYLVGFYGPRNKKYAISTVFYES